MVITRTPREVDGAEEPPNGSGCGDRRNDCGNKLIAIYLFKGRMKDSPISELTSTETGHRLSQFKKICNALPVFCADKNYTDLDEVLRTGRDKVKMTSCRLILTPISSLIHTKYKSPLS